MPRIKPLYVVWLLVCLVLLWLSFNYRGEATWFYGIAETQEIAVSSESAVEVKKIHAVAGQTVAKGQILVELSSPDLTSAINEVSHELDEVAATIEARESEIRYYIKQLRAQDAINRELITGMKSLPKDHQRPGAAPAGSPIQIQIEGLRHALELEKEPLKIKISMLERELHLLLAKSNSLYITAQVSGIIGAVNSKAGEQVAPFQTIMTLHTKSPRYVRGYIHEFASTGISVGQRAQVVSLANPAYSLTGNVVGINSKITAYPSQLERTPALKLFGREIQIEIPAENSLLLGEKVMVKPCHTAELSAGLFFKDAFSFAGTAGKAAAPPTEGPQGVTARDVTVQRPCREGASRELSGLVYLNDLKKYLVASDSTGQGRPVLYLMSAEGAVEEEVIIQGLPRIDDVEAMAPDPVGSIYIACSQSAKHSDSPAEERKLLVRLRRDRALLQAEGTLPLYDLLCEAARENPEADWSRLLSARKAPGSLKLNIEGIFYHQGNLYLGLKKPLQDKRAVILRVADIAQAFESRRLAGSSVAIWKAFDLADQHTNLPAGISDLCLLGDRVYILACPRQEAVDKNKKTSSLWAYDIAADRLDFISRFDGFKAEGLAFNPDTKKFAIVCDHGKNAPSKLLSIGGPP